MIVPKFIKLGNSGEHAIVDESDYADLVKWRWFYTNAGYASRATNQGRKKWISIPMHRYLLKAPKGQDVDHINGNKLDNRRCNLRLVTRSHNKARGGVTKRNTSGYRGVSWDKRANKWLSIIIVNGKRIHIGLFDDIKAAAMAYNREALYYFGEYSYWNEI